MCVEQNCERIAEDAFALVTRFADLVPWKNHANASRVRLIPIRVAHFSAVGFEPVEIFDFRSVDRATLKKMSPPKDRFGFSQTKHLAHEVEQLSLFSGESPIEPR